MYGFLNLFNFLSLWPSGVVLDRNRNGMEWNGVRKGVMGI